MRMSIIIFIVPMIAANSWLAPPEQLRVGQVAPPVVALTIGGNFDVPSHYRDKYALLTFWSLKDAAGLRQFEQLRKIRQGMAKEDRLVIVDVCTDDSENDHETWRRFLEIQGKVAYGDRDRPGPFHFYEDHKWVNTFQDGSDFVSSKAYGVERLPETFLIGPDGRLLAVRIPADKLGDVVAEALKKAP
jgi:alkyl hydroperoxide reductase subunit AhpC